MHQLELQEPDDSASDDTFYVDGVKVGTINPQTSAISDGMKDLLHCMQMTGQLR